MLVCEQIQILVVAAAAVGEVAVAAEVAAVGVDITVVV